MYSNAYTYTHTYHARTEMRFRMGVRGVKYVYKGEVLAYKSADLYDDMICAMSQFVRKDPPPSLGTNCSKVGGWISLSSQRSETALQSVRGLYVNVCVFVCVCVCVCVC